MATHPLAAALSRSASSIRMACSANGVICVIRSIDGPINPYSLAFIDASTGVESAVTIAGPAFPNPASFEPVEMVWADAAGKWYVAFHNDPGTGRGSPWSLYSITPTSAGTATVALVSTTGTAPSWGGIRRGLYYSRDWKCLIAYDGYPNPLRVLRV